MLPNAYERIRSYTFAANKNKKKKKKNNKNKKKRKRKKKNKKKRKTGALKLLSLFTLCYSMFSF